MLPSSRTSHTQKSSIGQRLITARVRAHLSQEALAEAINASARSVQRWERDQAVPQGQSRERLCQVLQVSHEFLFESDAKESNMLSVGLPWVVPHRRNPFFTGREELLHSLHNALSQQKRADLAQACVLTGMGGMGKTQVALEYAYRYAQSYSATFWVEAEGYETIISSFTAIATYLELPEALEQDQQKMIVAVKRWLDLHNDWLLIMDNVEDVEIIKAFVPTANRGTLLLTTRKYTLGTFALPIEVLPMPLEESILFLLRRVRLISAPPLPALEVETIPQHTLASTIAEMMDGLPLALDQAGAYIDEAQCSLADFLDLFRSSPLQLLQERNTSSDHPHSVAKIFSLSLEKVRQIHSASADVLIACSFLAPDILPDRLLTQGGACLGAEMQSVFTSSLEFNRTLKVLLAYSLIHRNPQTKTITVHRIVQTVLKHILSEEDRTFWMQRLLCLLEYEFPTDYESMESWSWCEQLLPHILHVLQQWKQLEHLETTSPSLFSLLTKIAAYLMWRGRYVEAEKVYQQIQMYQERTRGTIHEDVAVTLNQLGKLAYRQGKYQEAGEAFQRALSIRESVLGTTHPDVAILLNNLGDLAFKQGKYQEAEAFFQRTLSLREAALGATHPLLGSPLNNLAILYYIQKRYTDAEPILRQAILIREHGQGLKHLDLAYPLNTLALVYTALERYEEAEQAVRRALLIREQTQGQEHPDFSSPLSTLAAISLNQGRYEEAEMLYQRAISLLEKGLGHEHQEIVYCLYGLAKLSLQQERYMQAEGYLERALRLQERVVGREHPDTIDLWEGFVALYRKQERYEEALSYCQSALTMSERLFGVHYAGTVSLREEYTSLMQTLQQG